MKLNMPLLSVKLKMPQPRKNYIVRSKIFEQLLKIKEYKVTIVKSGAGSGKTTLLSSFVKETKLQNIKWITLDENANQAFVFWNYVIETVKEYFKNSISDFQTIFESNMQKENLWQILSLFVNELSVSEDVILVLDDFQVISEPFLISTIDYLIDNMPNNVHLIMLTREMPLIYLGTLAMEDEIMVIDESLIRLTKEESKKFLIDTLKLDKNDEQFNSMIEASEGWIGGLQLLAAAAKDKDKITMQSLKFSNRMLEDYISKEIFMFLSEEEQEFLVQTSILRYFSEDICKRFQPYIEFQSILKSIMQKNLFVISIDENEGVFRYHAILVEYLNGIFDKLEDNKKLYFHNLAADIYYDLGDYEESLYHLFSIENYEKIMKLILKMPQTALTFSYIMRVPMEHITKNTDFAFQYFFYYYASLDKENCEKIYNFIKTIMKEDENFPAFKHSNLFYTDKFEFCGVNILSIDQINQLPLSPVTTAFLLIKEAFFVYAGSRYDEALKYLERAEEVYKETGNIYIKYFVLSEKVMILEDMGELHLCINMYKEMEPIIHKIKTLAASYYIGITGVYLRQMRLDKAFESLKKAEETIPRDASNVERAYQYNLAEYYYIVGENEKTEKLLIDIMNQEIYQGIYFSARLLRYAIYRGENNHLAVEFEKQYENSDDIVKNMDTDLLCANIKYENGKFDEAMQLVDNIIAKARKLQNKLKIIEGDLLKVRMLFENCGDKRIIENLFLEAIFYANQNGTALPFWFEKKITEKMVSEMGTELQNKLSSDEWEFLCSVLKADSKAGIAQKSGKLDELTEREKEVLDELANGSTNKQIAEKLCISLATVKSHIINIYGKLEVNNRVAAVNKFKTVKKKYI